MKKISVILVIVIMITVLCACGNSSKTNGPSQTETTTEEKKAQEKESIEIEEIKYKVDDHDNYNIKVRNVSGKKQEGIMLYVQFLDDKGDIMGEDTWFHNGLIDDNQATTNEYYSDIPSEIKDPESIKIYKYCFSSGDGMYSISDEREIANPYIFKKAKMIDEDTSLWLTDDVADDVKDDKEGETTGEGSEDGKIYKIGETISTDMAEFTLDEFKFASRLGTLPANWLKPVDFQDMCLEAGDGNTYVWPYFTVKNLAKEEMGGSEVCNISAVYSDGYTYGDGAFTSGNVGSLSRDIGYPERKSGLTIMKPLEKEEYYGFIECVEDVRRNRSEPLYLVVQLPSTAGTVDFKYDVSAAEGQDISEQALAVSDAIETTLHNLGRVEKKHDKVIFTSADLEELRGAFDNLDYDYIDSNLPKTSKALSKIKKKINKVCKFIEENQDSSGIESLDEIEDDLNDAKKMMQDLQETELKAFN